MAFFKLLKKSPLIARVGLAMILLNIAAAILAPIIAPYGETEIVGDVWLPMSGEHYLGTDHIGRDMFTRLLYGARNTILIAFVITVFSFAIGISCGFFAATLGGVDRFGIEPPGGHPDGHSGPYFCTGSTGDRRQLYPEADRCHRFAGFHPGVSSVTGSRHGHRGHGVC